jgi:DNA-directed RNA polymerase specialized sigma24 family protein
VIGVNSSSVRVLLSRARAELAAKLSDHGLAPRASRGGTT